MKIFNIATMVAISFLLSWVLAASREKKPVSFVLVALTWILVLIELVQVPL